MAHETNSTDFWQHHYRDNRTPWDLGYPTPVFARLAANGDYPPGQMIVLGAGRGHDARLFAQHGFDVLAVDFASDAVAAMHLLNDDQHPVQVLQADIFELPEAMNGRFDYILEYTCFCAIDPARRREYAALAARLLKPGGLYIGLAFPIGQRPGGPPFVVQPDAMIELLTEHGFSLQHREFPYDSVPSRQNIEELIILQKSW
ncbi:methyltransferase domain-containing protein [Candidatus Leptofilum sp.]|uniref:methyltransferase domain-containing protein n=1 Tax=Candidatus Leptofilum sp. TaxID=3241576 RepID=UPI003B5C24B7